MLGIVSFSIRVGDVIAGKYRVERVLGEGGMGVVVAAMHLELGTRVAIKFAAPEARERRRSWSASCARRAPRRASSSEHVARVIDVGRLPDRRALHGDGVPRGRRPRRRDATTAARCRSSEVADYVLQACEALAEAHALGIVHRDLKPANLFLRRRSRTARARSRCSTSASPRWTAGDPPAGTS